MIKYKVSQEHQAQVTASLHKIGQKSLSPTSEELQVMKQYGKVVNS